MDSKPGYMKIKDFSLMRPDSDMAIQRENPLGQSVKINVVGGKNPDSDKCTARGLPGDRARQTIARYVSEK